MDEMVGDRHAGAPRGAASASDHAVASGADQEVARGIAQGAAEGPAPMGELAVLPVFFALAGKRVVLAGGSRATIAAQGSAV